MISKKKITGYNRHFDMPTRIGVTGSPATGKRSIGLALSRISGLNFLSINDYAMRHKLGHWMHGEFEVDTARIKGKIPCEGSVVVGHLLPYVVPGNDLEFVAILRCSPSVLRKRYSERAYPMTKIQENIQAEALDLIAQRTLAIFGRKKVSDFDTTRTRNPETTARRIIDTMQGKRARTFGAINWLEAASASAGKLRSLLKGDASEANELQE
jgi:adenylate kinase